MPAVRLASYNVHRAIGGDGHCDPPRILGVLREINADVIALQEADRRFGARASAIPLRMIEEHSDYKPVALDTRDGSLGWHGNAILIRKSADLLDCEVIHLPSLEPRGAVMADIRSGGGVIRVIGMHLDLSGLWRRRQAHAILAHVHASARQLPTVMMGDLNEWSAGGGCLRDFGRHMACARTGPSFHARRPIARLDRILVSQKLTIEDAGTHSSPASRTASDHLPIWARLTL